MKKSQAIHLYVYRPLGGEEKAGFGAQPRDFDTILPCSGDISNNIKGFGASNFNMLLRGPIPQWYLASRGAVPLSLGGGSALFGQFGLIHLDMYIESVYSERGFLAGIL